MGYNEELVEQIQQNIDVKSNMEKLYNENLPLITMLCRPYKKMEDMQDLLQVAYFGLNEAVKHYDSSHNILFMSYADYWIKATIIRHLDNNGSIVRLPSYIQERINKYYRVKNYYELLEGRQPTNDELMKELKINQDELDVVLRYSSPLLSLDAPINDTDDIDLKDSIESDIDIESDIIEIVNQQELWRIISENLNEREAHILQDRFIHNKTLKQIGEEYGISSERAKQIRDIALNKLRKESIKQQLIDELDVIDSRIFKDTISVYRHNNFSSNVEKIALKLITHKRIS